ncbi:MAG: TlpA disulfide reductase family protein [Rubrivivax sp.]
MTRRRRTVLIAGIGGAGVLAGVGAALWRDAVTLRGPSPAADPAGGGAAEAALVGADDVVRPAFWGRRFPRPEGGELELGALRGQLLLLNFWATWCAPCVRELPLLDRFQRAQADAGWRVVGIAVDSLGPVREFLQRQPLAFAVGLAGLEGSRLSRQLGNADGALPFSVVIDRSGRVRARVRGETTASQLAAWAEDARAWP